MPHVLPTDLPADGTFGYSVEQMLQLQAPPEPPGFEAFWRDTYQQTLAVPLELTSEPVEALNRHFTASLLHFNGFEGLRLGAWLIVPRDTPPERFIVVGHGYYHKPFTDCGYQRGAAAIYICCRGLSISASPKIPKETTEHAVFGIEKKETYVHRGCVADTWSAASALLSLYPQAVGQIEYQGGSFGGGIGATALPWDDRFIFGSLVVPSFGNYPLRVTLDSGGSGAATRKRWLKDPSVLDVLAYFDSATHAARIKVPVHVAAAAYDTVVPPPGQFTVYNAIQSPKKLFVLQAGHLDWPGKNEDEAAGVTDREVFRRSIFA